MAASTSEAGYNARVEDFRDVEYPMLNGSVYLDHAGTTIYAKSLMERFARDMASNLFGNPHSASASSQRSTARIEDIRLRVLRFFNADPAEFDLVFVANATAGIKLVADALRASPDGRADAAPDFTVLSFYKIFGFPDLGALLVRREAEDVFESRRYFGGGTVDMVVCLKEQWHAPKRQFLHERLEDGTLPIHNIIALDAALDVHKQLFGSMRDIAAHTSFLLRRLYRGLQSLRHGNGEPVCALYSAHADGTEMSAASGPVIAFNIRNSLGAWVSLTEVEKLAVLKGFHIRTGGVCNPGGIASALGLEPWEMKQNFSSGFRCGTENDIMAGKPTGVIRVSLGAMSTISDVDSFVNFVAEFYRDVSPASRMSKPMPQPQSTPRLYVHSISIYPIKSCGSFQIPPDVDWEVRPEGLAWDREWCLVHQGTGQALNQKRHPKMALIRPRLDFERGELRVRFAGEVPAHLPQEVSIPLSKNPSLFHSPVARSRTSRVCGEEVEVRTYSLSEINGFFSDVLGVPCLLARFPPGGQGKSMRHSKAHLQKHQVSLPHPSRGSLLPGSFPPSPPDSDTERVVSRRILLSNESPILAITLPSVDALNQDIQAAQADSARKVSPAVFRANIVIGPDPGHPEGLPPYAEDSWSGVRIGRQQHGFEMLGACRRCHMVCIDQETAEKSEEPFVTLSKTRRFDGKVFFGVHMCYHNSVADQGGGPGLTAEAQFPTVRVGDVVVPEWRREE
ncbi:3dbc00f9-fe5c-4635-b5dc-305979b4254a [Thermothielavioides terrestris]|uniref:Molybdenum cofactor sulfurase n=1 Tax=Thermothielavioides terrestris TaxID=2587410 RepID=A0A446B6T5_9PEZI|nr:3dbc00f9-fe5c-4635-b5dc-305979b4254a [Thermothielavioides terrestris]